MGISLNKRIESIYRKSEFIIQKKALALLYFTLLMIFLLVLVVLAYAIVNPSGILKAVVGAGSIMLLMALCIFFIIKGKLDYAVFTFTVPTITETATNIGSGYEMFNEINRIIIDINGTLEQANRLSLEMNESSENQLGLSGTAFEEVKGVNTLAFSISTSMQEQAANAAEISRSFDSINEITQNNAAASEEVSASTDSLNEHIGGLLAIVREGEGERGKNA